MKRQVCIICTVVFLSCNENAENKLPLQIVDSPSTIQSLSPKDKILPVKHDSISMIRLPVAVDKFQATGNMVNTGIATPAEIMQFAETLIGIPYVWASVDPKIGFDCSGFITYVFSHFKIQVPRSSVDFTNVGKTVAVEKAKRGDFILFTGTNSSETNIGHMGLVVSNTPDGLFFIHATSGKAMAVTITKLNELYKKRFVRISRIFQQND